MKILKCFFITLCIIFDILTFTKPVTTANLDKSQLLPILKIAIVNSYDIDHVCGSPQTQGIITGLGKLDNIYQLDIHVWYMKTDLIFTTQDKIEYISKKVIHDIKAFNPDYIFTVDDAAFKHIGIYFSQTHKVFFSGLNKPFLEYASSESNLIKENCYGVEEIIYIDRFFKMLSKLEFYPSKFWILADSSTTSYYLSKNYKEQIESNTTFSAEIIVINKVSNLREVLNNLQKQKRGIIIYTFQNLLDSDYNVIKSKKVLISDIIKYNNKHLELCENDFYTKHGISMTLSPDFYNMGASTSRMFKMFILKNSWDPNNITSLIIFSINIKRLEELGFGWIYNKIIEEVDGSYAVY